LFDAPGVLVDGKHFASFASTASCDVELPAHQNYFDAHPSISSWNHKRFGVVAPSKIHLGERYFLL
jgi:hypothetical protein